MGVRHVAAGLISAFAATLPLAGLAATDLGSVPAQEPISFDVDADLSGGFAVDVDGVDVTEFATLSDGVLIVDPMTRLSGGAHDITVYALSDGGYDALGTWTVHVEGGLALTSLNVSATHEAEARDLNGDTNTAARSYGSAEAQLNDGQISASGSYVASSVAEEQPNGRAIDLEQYLLEFRQSSGRFDLHAALGHQVVDFDNVLVSDLSRRGISLQVDTSDQRASFAVFGAAASDLSGVDNISGVGEADNRIEGYYAAVRPFAGNDLRLSVIGQRARGAAFGGTDVGSGDGIGVALDGSGAEGRLRYALGAAQSDWDPDAEGGVYASDRGQAFVGSLEYDVADGPWNAGGDRALTLGLLYERVDDTYMSLANQGLASGQTRLRGSADYYTGQLSLSFAAERQETNVNGPPTQETDAIYTVQMDGSYVPLNAVTAFGAAGSALWDFGAVLTMQDRLKTPVGAPDPTDFTSAELYAGYSQQYDYWSWRLGYGFIDYNDRSTLNVDSRSHRIEGTLDWSGTGALSGNLYAAADLVRDDLGNHLDTQVSVTGAWDISPGVWALNGTLSHNTAQSALGSNGVAVTADLVRTLTETAELVASAGYSTDDLAAETTDSEEWFVGVLLRLRTDVIR